MLLTIAKTVCEEMQLHYVHDDDNILIEFDGFNALITKTELSSGLLILCHFPFEILEEKLDESFKYVNLVNSSLEFGHFTVFEKDRRICLFMSNFLDENAGDATLKSVICEMITMAANTAWKFIPHVETFLKSEVSADEAYLLIWSAAEQRTAEEQRG